jgi:hypothetical protein
MITLQLDYKDDNDQDDSSKCSICFNFPNRAKLLDCCNNLICSLCAKDWFRTKDTCPFCRAIISSELLENGLKDHKIQERLQQMNVACPMRTYEIPCEWEGQRSSIRNHLRNECDVFKVVKEQERVKLSDFALSSKWHLVRTPPENEVVVVNVPSTEWIEREERNLLERKQWTLSMVTNRLNILIAIISLAIIIWIIVKQLRS